MESAIRPRVLLVLEGKPVSRRPITKMGTPAASTAAQVAFPEIDVRQRLTVSAGYGVVELSINEGAALVAAGTTIGD